MAIEKKMSKKKPPKETVQSVQFDLFKSFLTNDKNDVSNTVEVWESIPKYFISNKQSAKLRTASGLAEPFKWNYKYKDNQNCTVQIQPALIEQDDGSFKAFFPWVTEEIVEEALKKILTEQQWGIHVPEKEETWIRFTLKMIQRELKHRKKSRSLTEIKQAITIMNKCVISFSINGREVWSGSILQDLVTVNRDEYIEDKDAKHIARLPLFVSNSINRLEYRQFNYDRLMSCSEQLSRWLYKRLINNFSQANYMNDYHFMFSSIKQSGLLQRETDNKNRLKVISSLNELVERGVLMSYTTHDVKEGRKIMDVKYVVKASPNFVSEQKASNKRNLNNQSIAKNSPPSLTGNST